MTLGGVDITKPWSKTGRLSEAEQLLRAADREKAGDPDEAIAAFELALKADPKYQPEEKALRLARAEKAASGCVAPPPREKH